MFLHIFKYTTTTPFTDNMKLRSNHSTSKLIMNHDSRFIIGIANVFRKNPNRIHTLKKHPPTKNNPLVVLCNEYRSTSKYQVKRKKYEQFWENWDLPFYSYSSKFIILFCFTDLQPLSYTSTRKNYTALLPESFRMSMTYLKPHIQQIANQPSPQ